MEELIKRFVRICDKYYETAEETGGTTGLEWIIGEPFADYSVNIGESGITMFLSVDGEAHGHLHPRILEHRKRKIALPPDLKDFEMMAACATLETNFERVAEAWQDVHATRSAATKARLQKEIEDKQRQLESL